MILVPVKLLADAKQRLSAVLSREERLALARAMCEDVLQALAVPPLLGRWLAANDQAPTAAQTVVLGYDTSLEVPTSGAGTSFSGPIASMISAT